MRFLRALCQRWLFPRTVDIDASREKLQQVMLEDRLAHARVQQRVRETRFLLHEDADHAADLQHYKEP